MTPDSDDMHEYSDIDTSYEKHADWLVYGPKLQPDLAVEIIRRTDLFFIRGYSDCPGERHAGMRLGIPGSEMRQIEIDGWQGTDDGEYFRRLRHFLSTWGHLTAGSGDNWLPIAMLFSNRMVSLGHGWCYPDGTIALMEEVERGYPDSILGECELLGQAFPELSLSVAYWGNHRQKDPTLGVMLRGGIARFTRGDDPRLFGDFGGLTVEGARDVAIQAAEEASGRLAHRSSFAGREWDRRGVDNSVLELWIDKARGLGLANGESELS